MRRHHDIDLGLAEIRPQHTHYLKNPNMGTIPDGLGAILGDPNVIFQSASGIDETARKNANAILTLAMNVQPFGKSDWGYLRSKFYEFCGRGAKTLTGQDDSVAKTRINAVYNAYKNDLANPAFTSWDNTELGSWFAYGLRDAWNKAGWGKFPAQDSELKKLGNKIALGIYKQNFKDTIWNYNIVPALSSGPVNLYTEYLTELGINNPDSRPVSYWVANPSYNPKQEGGLTQPQTPQPTIQPPPFQYGKLNATDLILRDKPSKDGKKIRSLDPPLVAQLIGVAEGFVQVMLKDGTKGWTTSGSDTKSYWLPVEESEYYGIQKPQTQETGLRIPPQATPQQIPTAQVGITVPQQQLIPPQQQQPIQQPQQPPQEQPKEEEEKEKPKEKKSNTGMYIGIGVGVLVLGGVAYMLTRKKD